jgi:hypothetical protein
MSLPIFVLVTLAGLLSSEAPEQFLGDADLILQRWRAEHDRWHDYECVAQLTFHNPADHSGNTLPPEQWKPWRTEQVRYVEDLVNGYYYVERLVDGNATKIDAFNEQGEYQTLIIEDGENRGRIMASSLMPYAYFPFSLAFREYNPGLPPMLPASAQTALTLSLADDQFSAVGANAQCVPLSHGWLAADKSSMGGKEWKAFLDAPTGCLPRRIDFYNYYGKLHTIIRDIEYTQLPEGAFPTAATAEHYERRYSGAADKGSLKVIVKITIDPATLVVNQQPDASVFSIDWPEGTPVRDEVRDTYFIASTRPLPDLLDQHVSEARDRFSESAETASADVSAQTTPSLKLFLIVISGILSCVAGVAIGLRLWR